MFAGPWHVVPQTAQRARIVELVPGSFADELDIGLRDASAVRVFRCGRRNVADLREPPDEHLVGGAQRVFDRRADPDDEHHHVVAGVEWHARGGAYRLAVTLP